MKRYLALLAAILFAATVTPVRAQAATRPAILTWTASTSTGVTGYGVFRCAVVSPATTCVPNTAGTPLATVSGLTYTDNPVIGTAYGYSVVAEAASCSSTTGLTAVCGNSAGAGPGYVPVPLLVDGAHSVTVVIP